MKRWLLVFALLSCAIQAATVTVVASGGDLAVPFGVAFDAAGNLYAPEFTKNCIWQLDPNGKTRVVVGTGKAGYAGDGGPALQAQINWEHNCIIAGETMYIADTGNFCVRKVDLKTGLISTVAGTGKKGNSGDGGPATQAACGGIYCVAIDAEQKHLYLCDLDNKRIRVVDLSTGIIATLAGNGKRGVPADGSAANESPLVDPRAVAVDSKRNVYILERGGNALRVVDAGGKIRTVAGTGKSGPPQAGAVDALHATFGDPKHLCCDGDDNVIIADTASHVIRKYSPATGKVETIVGSKLGSAPITPGTAPLSVTLSQPHGVYVDAKGVLWIADSYNNRILRVDR
jgi:hypothetical protein